MMARLIVIEGPDRGKTVEIKTKPVLIGRDGPSCDLTLTDVKISRVHAQVLLLSNGGYLLEDLNSTNSTFVRSKKIEEPFVIVPGDKISLGKSILLFETGADVEKQPGATHGLRGGGIYQPAGGSTRALKVTQGTINIGRDTSNDFVLDHPMVSRHHARIVSQGGKYTIYDLGSANGTYVDGRSVEKSAELMPASLIQICGYRYYFDGQTLNEYNDNSGQVKLEVRNLTKTVTLPGGKTKQLLNNINLVIQPREFVAILGGSGAGKSTLMGALSGLRPATDGEVLVNGLSLYKEHSSFRSMIGYVPQDDIVYRELTVKEVLTYASGLRRPDDTSEAEIVKTVNQVMADLELTGRQDVLVKDLSGGQRKRVSIGVELLTKPSLFFLDEPTSGLDPGLEKVMMELLRKLANQGHTVVLITHATFNIKLCDKVVFLTEGGNLAFFGTPSEALKYFGVDDFAEIYKKVETEKSPHVWAKSFEQSPVYCKHILGKVGDNQVGAKATEFGKGTPSNKAKASPFKQWWLLTRRYAHIMSRDRRNLMVLLLQAIVIPALIVMVFSHNAPLFKESKHKPDDLKITQQVIASGKMEQVQERNQEEAARRRNMSLCVVLMVLVSVWLGASSSIREVVKELPIYRRERLVTLRVAPYLLSKVAILSVLCLVQSVLLVGIISLGLGLPDFWRNLAAVYLVSLASAMMGLTISALVSNVDKAQGAMLLILLPQIILSGALVPISEVRPEYLKYIFYLAVSKWGYELSGGGICNINGRVALEKPIEELNGNFANHWFILAGCMVALYIISTYVIMRKDKMQE